MYAHLILTQVGNHVPMAWDWLSPVIAGGVGVMGMAGTIWGNIHGSRTQLATIEIQADVENLRQAFTERRELYAKVLHMLGDLEESTNALLVRKRYFADQKASKAGTASLVSARQEYTKAQERHRASTFNARKLQSEVALVAERDVTGHLTVALKAIVAIQNQASYDEYNTAWVALVEAMREELSRIE